MSGTAHATHVQAHDIRRIVGDVLIDRIALALADNITVGRDHGCLHDRPTPDHTIVVHGHLDLRALARAAIKGGLVPEAAPFPSEWKLTKTEERILAVLVAIECASKAAIIAALYAERRAPPDEQIVDVFICKLRKKLKAFNVEIHTVWGQGYRLSAVQREMLRPKVVA